MAVVGTHLVLGRKVPYPRRLLGLLYCLKAHDTVLPVVKPERLVEVEGWRGQGANRHEVLVVALWVTRGVLDSFGKVGYVAWHELDPPTSQEDPTFALEADHRFLGHAVAVHGGLVARLVGENVYAQCLETVPRPSN